MYRTFLHIKNTIMTTMTGMMITGKYFKPGTEVTHLYPEEAPVTFERTRGKMNVVMEKCIACMLCAKACPVECITIETEKKIEGKGKRAALFRIDYSRCMYCGLCVEACPTDAIVHTGKCDYSSYDIDELIEDFGLGFYTEEEKEIAREKKKLEEEEKGRLLPAEE